MKKLIIVLMLLLIPLVLALEECDSPIEPDEIPCQVISTYGYEPNCTSNVMRIYDSDAALVGSAVWDDYGATGLCNMTFNFTTRDSYTLNSSDGSIATIIVRGEKMDILRLAVFGIFFLMSLVFIGFMHKFQEDVGSSVAYGFFATAILFILGSLTMFGYQVINVTSMTLPFDVNKILGLLCFVIGVYSGWYSTALMGNHRRSNERSDYEPY